MRITDIRCYPVRMPLVHVFKAAYGIRATADFVVVEVVADDKISGWGEASTIPIYDTGSQADVIYVIENYYKPLLMGKDPTCIAELLASLDGAVKSARYAKCAIDFALHDLAGKIYGLPVYKLLGGSSRELPVCWVLSAKAPADISSEAAEKLKEGYKTFKLKVGTDMEADVTNLATLREVVGADVAIRLDGNEAWNAKQALSILKRFAVYNPEHLEQPVPAWDLEGLHLVRNHSDIPIVADEGILSAKDAMRFARGVAADRVNIKVSRAGGILESRKIAAVAQAAGQFPFAGSNLELGIGTVASAHLFAAMPEISIATELVGPLLLKEDIVIDPIEYCDGKLILSDKPGFGVEPDRALFEKYAG